MDGNFENMKPWKCKSGHVLGVYDRATVDAKIEGQTVRYHTTKLIIFRQAINMESERLEAVDAAGTIYGRMLLGFSWRCSVPGCGCIREWNPDDEALDWLKKRFEGSKK